LLYQWRFIPNIIGIILAFLRIGIGISRFIVSFSDLPYITSINSKEVIMSKDLSAVLDMAINKEIEAQAFYQDLLGLVADAEAKQALQFMVREEKKHEEFLVQYKTSGMGCRILKTESSR
jgi:demethoxyubiquinone hydroxylase (CLK1/Coq7/Cat5 family)